MTIESRIDDLYGKPLDEFLAGRSALASELKGADARRVRQLKKPTSVPWAVNQVYWHARALFDRVQRSGGELRRAQIAALEGRSADVHGAAAAHRKAIASAVERAIQLAEAAGVHPGRAGLARTFETLSLTSTPDEPPGRLTHPLQPGGFEMLAGVKATLKPTVPKAGHAASTVQQGPSTPRSRTSSSRPAPVDAKRLAAAERARQLQEAAAARRRAAAIKQAEAAVERAQSRASQAERVFEQAKQDLDSAKRALSNLQS